MSLIRFHCYVCNQELQVGADKAGRKAKCVQCATVLTIPSHSSEEIEPGPPPGPPGPPGPPPGGGEAFRGDDEPAPRRGRDDDDRPGRRDDDRGRRDDDYDDRPRDEGRRRDDDYDRPRRGRDDDRREDDYDRPRRGREDDRRDDDYDRPRRDRDRDDFDRRDDYDDYDDRPGKAKKWKTQYSKVRVGMLLAFIGMCVVGGGLLLEQIGALIVTFASFGQTHGMTVFGTMRIMAMIGNIIMLLGFLCLIAGQVFWIFTTNKYGGMVWAIVSLGVAALAIVFFIVFRLLAVLNYHCPYGFWIFAPRFATTEPGLGAALLPTFALMLTCTHLMMVGFYLRAFGMTAKDRWTSGRGLQIVITAGVAAGFALIWPFIAWAFLGPMPTVGSIIGIWLFYWGAMAGVIALIVTTTVTLNMARVLADR